MQVAAIAEPVTHTNVLKVKVGSNRQLDTYLSPLGYKGIYLGIGNEWWQPFRQDTRLGQTGRLANWAHVGRVDVTGFRNISSAKTNSFYGLELTGGWGAFYCWSWFDHRLRVFAGPYLEAGLTTRYLSVNVNKPLSLDIAADLMAMGGINWSFYGKKTSYRLHYQVRTNIIGFDFMPEYWQSYYELYEGIHGTPRCSGHWNHHTIKHELGLDMQFPHSTWRVGAAHEWIRYGSQHMHFERHQISLVIGCIWKYRIKANEAL